MSILPTQTQGSTSSSSSSFTLSQNPNSQHGLLSSSSLSHQTLSFGSLHISHSQSPISADDQVTGPSIAAAEDAGGSSKEVSELGTPNGKKTFPHTNMDACFQGHSGGGQVGSSHSKGKVRGNFVSPQMQQNSGSINAPRNTMHAAGRRAQMMNGNHLLNFHYDPISHPQPRPHPPPRRQKKIKPYNKDLFLQANYKFVMLDTGHCTSESMDPDKMLLWEDVVCVRYSTPSPVQCPVCLEYPLCPQITSCGHIFCFPCILQYLLMGKEDVKRDCLKRCPLCFVMVSPKDLYTIYIENVKQYHVGDPIEFRLLTRQKDSFTPSEKHKQVRGAMPCPNDSICDPFSKFIFTSDVDLSVRKAISELDSWLARADSGLVDDLEKLPYVCAAMEQLKQRKKYWIEHLACENKLCRYSDHDSGSCEVLLTANATNNGDDAGGFECRTLSTSVSNQTNRLDKFLSNNCDGLSRMDQSAGLNDSLEGEDPLLSPSYVESKSLQRHSNGSTDGKDKESYNFYQAADGQHLILHPLNMKCLLHHYGSYDVLPDRISGRILQLETATQSEAMRRRYRYLSHFSLTTSFQLCEVDLSEVLPPDALRPFMDEIRKREKQRKQLAKKERKEQVKAEAASAAAQFMYVSSSSRQSSYYEPPTFSMEDFEALGNSAAISSSPPTVGERKLFSSVTRLGFAAGHDSPDLKIEEGNARTDNGASNESSDVVGLRNSGTPSFANVISREKAAENMDAPRVNEMGKKGKKPSRVLLSTAGGRRY